jgi:peptidoglycan hydrolase CwlO-like protein
LWTDIWVLIIPLVSSSFRLFSFAIVLIFKILIVFQSFFQVEEKKEKTLNNIVTAKNKIRYEIQELNERLKQRKEMIQKLKDELSKVDEHINIEELVESVT